MSNNNYTTIKMEWRFPHIGETVDLDGQDDLRARVRRLCDDFQLTARVLDCEPEEVSMDVDVSATVDFGAKEEVYLIKP